MKTAFSYWDNRIAPVFDIARHVLLIEAEAGEITAEKQENLADDVLLQRAVRLTELGIQTLVCGAISRPYHELVESYGIRVIPFIAGGLREVIQAWLANGLNGNTFVMPGCCGRNRNSLNRKGLKKIKEVEIMPQGNGTGPLKSGRGQGQGRAGRGRRGGLQAGGPSGFCVCPACGHKESHERSIPCYQKTCPKCGTALVRE